MGTEYVDGDYPPPQVLDLRYAEKKILEKKTSETRRDGHESVNEEC